MSFEIRSERLFIRPWRPVDEPGFRNFVADTEMMRFMGGGKPWPEARIQDFFARQTRTLALRNMCMAAAVDRLGNELIGVAGLQPHSVTGDIEVGWWVGRSRWGQGYATEAGGACLEHASRVLGLERVVAIADPANHASLAVMKKLGMRFEGIRIACDLEPRYGNEAVALYSIALTR